MAVFARVLLAALALLLPVTASAFSIIFPVRVHQDITETALEDMNILIAVAPDITVRFSSDAIEVVKEYNVLTDKLQGLQHSDKHFDSDDLGRGSRRLMELRREIVWMLVSTSFADLSSPSAEAERFLRVRDARKLMGEALHTLQDFYAHTNWVERGNYSTSSINRALGVSPLKAPAFTEACDADNPATAPLTSAWSTDSSSPYYWSGLCEAPNNKCAHGWVLGNDRVCAGLNKDSDLQTTTQAYLAAYFQARLATYEFVRDTLQQVLESQPPVLVDALGEAGAQNATRLAVCQFMGVPDAFSTCLTSNTVTVQKLNQANGQATLEGLVQSSGDTVTPVIDCGLVCQGTAVTSTSVTLTASGAGDWRFVRWAEGGVCPGSTNPECTLIVDGNKLAKAEFTDEPEPEPTSFQGEIVLTGPAAITGTGCTGTMTLTGTAIANLQNSPTLTINGSESINLSCYSSTGPVYVTVQLEVIGNSITGEFIGPFTCPAPCVSGQSTYIVNLQRIGSGSNQILQGTIDYTNQNQTPFLATTTGAVTLYAE